MQNPKHNVSIRESIIYYFCEHNPPEPTTHTTHTTRSQITNGLALPEISSRTGNFSLLYADAAHRWNALLADFRSSRYSQLIICTAKAVARAPCQETAVCGDCPSIIRNNNNNNVMPC